MVPALNPDIRPVIALLTEIKEGAEPDFGNVHSFCEELHQGIAERGGSFYVFSLSGFDEGGVNGYYNGQDGWTKGKLPLPHVIYNRLSSRRTELGSRYETFLNKLDALGIKIFNQRFLSKWETHEFLLAEDHLHPFLPETLPYSRDSLTKMLEKHEQLYIKPIHGSQGRRIIRLAKEQETVQASFSSSPEKIMPPFTDMDSLAKLLAKKTEKLQCLIQQGIQLAEWNGRKMDFRVLCHKNFQSFWKVSSIVARVSAESNFVSNVARGGEVLRPYQALAHVFGKRQAHQQVALMKELAIEIADAIGRRSQGLTAELGLDLGIDSDGNLWLIEVNWKPSKNFEERGEKLRPSTKAIIEHCFGLTGAFGPGGKGR